MITATRANFLPEPRFVPMRPALQEHLAKLGAAVTPENFLSICDEMLLKLLKDTFARISADEGSIWLLDQEKQNLVVAFNSGPDTDKIMGFKQPTSKGIARMISSPRKMICGGAERSSRRRAIITREERLYHRRGVIIVFERVVPSCRAGAWWQNHGIDSLREELR